MILAGDVGGTKTHLALYEPGAAPRKPVLERRFASRDFPTPESMLTEFLGATGARPERGVFGIAGPVVDNRSEVTNLPWVMDGRNLSTILDGAPVTLLNDLETTAWGIATLGTS